MRRISRVVAMLILLLSGAACLAGSPRWQMGLPYYTGIGVFALWRNDHPLYYTDAGDLSDSVNHAAADAMVAAAANIWNVPQTSLVLGQGGVLNEHVSGANVYMSAAGPVFPGDAMASNAKAKPIAVIYDSDGSVTDLLLGSGASDPMLCQQHGVTDVVDLLTQYGDIQHAMLILNGRCTGPAPEQQLQMRYQLERAFGRILGLGWSQLNDNVFTGMPLPTRQQMLYWPIMHPIDIVCGPYTYQCMLNPFQLRPDDISTLALLYPVGYTNIPAGKQLTIADGDWWRGYVYFPTGQGMQGVNVVAQTGGANSIGVMDQWQLVSAVSGMQYQQSGYNPVTGMPPGQRTDGDTLEQQHEGYYMMGRIPIVPQRGIIANDLLLTTEAINPLYVGEYSVGATVAQTIAPSGSGWLLTRGVIANGGGNQNLNQAGAAADCDARQDGSAMSPAAVTAGGWWSGRLCARGHSAWSMLTVKAGRTLTMEVTALDEKNHVSTAKAMPVMGVWSAADATGTLPTVAATASPFNSLAVGMTTLTVTNAQARTLRMVIADQRGDGRPDFAYQARVLYADAVTPARLPAQGGRIVITGMGFRAGNQVTVGGVNAEVMSWSATQIVAVAPALSAVAASPDVMVRDVTTNGTSTMSGALTYNGAPADVLRMVTAPSGNVPVGTAAPAAFAARLLLADGVTPVANAPVTFAGSGTAALLGACSAASCVVSTDDSGYASTAVTPQAVGTVSLTATAAGGASLSDTFAAVAVTRSVAALRPVEYVAANTVVTWMPQVDVALNGAAAGSTAVAWSATGASVGSAQSMTNVAGVAQSPATTVALPAGAQATVQACAWIQTCATMTAQAVDASLLRLNIVSGQGQSVMPGAKLMPVTLRVTDGANDPVAGATVTVHQSVEGQQTCPSAGRCPTPPVYGTSVVQVTSDEDGLVTVQPLQVGTQSEVVKVAASAGTQGFVSLALQVGP